MITREQVAAVIERVRPLIQRDGGDIELVDVADNRARVRMSGNCVGCPSAAMTLYVGLEQALREDVPGFEELVVL
jgi:Fe-S cluster biogenesis protein NfuA